MFNSEIYIEIREFLKKNNKKCQIIAVSKNHPLESVIQALESGNFIFGENRVLEAKDKFSKLKTIYPNIELHLTGPLQSNKVKLATELFDVFHTLDREKIAREFSKYRDNIQNKKIFVQVNTGEETKKSGVSPKDVNDFVHYCQNEIELNIVGLMCIPPLHDRPESHFEILTKLAKQNNLKQLSIGMSGDYLQAIKFNPTYIRLGTILFGERNWARILIFTLI